MSRFDPTPGEPYGKCVAEDCGFVGETREAVNSHFAETMAKGSGSHSVRITNPTRQERIGDHVDGLVDSALDDVCDSLDNLRRAGQITGDEIREALRSTLVDVEYAWDEWSE